MEINKNLENINDNKNIEEKKKYQQTMKMMMK